MEKAKLDEILANHKKWLEGNGGEKADLREADLRGVCLRNVDLSGGDLSYACLRYVDLSGVCLRETCLRNVDLRETDLRHADLRGVDLDFSCFPLWCGGTNFKCSDKLILQLLAHISTLEYESNIITEEHRALFLELGKHSHRAKDLGLK